MSTQKICQLTLALVIALYLSGCMFLKPDYLKIITAEQLHQSLHQDKIFLVDVHIPEQKHIKGTADFIPFNKIEQNIDKFPSDKSAPIYLYCESGPMGNAAARALHKLGYENISNLKSGAKAWKKAGYEFAAP
jgi:rhodanese-related sulfurtransferase